MKVKYPLNLIDVMNKVHPDTMTKYKVSKKELMAVVDDENMFPPFTEREKQVLDLVFKEGKTLKEAGALLPSPLSGSRTGQIKAKALLKLRRRIVKHYSSPKPYNWSLDKFKDKMSSQFFLAILETGGGGQIDDDLAHAIGMKSAHSIWNKLYHDSMTIYDIMRLADYKGVDISIGHINGTKHYINTEAFCDMEVKNG